MMVGIGTNRSTVEPAARPSLSTGTITVGTVSTRTPAVGMPAMAITWVSSGACSG